MLLKDLTRERDGKLHNLLIMNECEHGKIKLRKRTLKNGSFHYANQCIICGQQYGTAIKKTNIDTSIDISTIEEFDSVIIESWKENYENSRLEIYEEYDTKFELCKNRYYKYLESKEWKAKSKKVISRAQGICEGCRDNEATCVHHLTYENIYDEFLFQLVALCDHCHNRIHPDK